MKTAITVILLLALAAAAAAVIHGDCVGPNMTGSPARHRRWL